MAIVQFVGFCCKSKKLTQLQYPYKTQKTCIHSCSLSFPHSVQDKTVLDKLSSMQIMNVHGIRLSVC